jgi:DNA-binding transcriptional MerR regulator
MDGPTATITARTYTVGQLARLARVSVRTLHHYDRLGLLSPARRSRSGYRLYDHDDLERLQTILLYRELDLPLDAIRRLVADPAFDRRSALLAQRERLAERIERSTRILGAIDTALDALQKGRPMDEADMFEVFGDFDPRTHEAEARERWGGTDAYAESARRTARYSNDDWRAIRAEGEAITSALGVRLAAGVPPTDGDVQVLVERHRLHIDRWYYPCPLEMHVGLADMYVADARFAATWEAARPGLARFFRDAVRASAGLPPLDD